jgi:hypothetical protein
VTLPVCLLLIHHVSYRAITSLHWAITHRYPHEPLHIRYSPGQHIPTQGHIISYWATMSLVGPLCLWTEPPLLHTETLNLLNEPPHLQTEP